jgi:hypothetical protein
MRGSGPVGGCLLLEDAHYSILFENDDHHIIVHLSAFAMLYDYIFTRALPFSLAQTFKVAAWMFFKASV